MAAFFSFYLILFAPLSGAFAGLVGGYRAAVPVGVMVVLVNRLFVPEDTWSFALIQAVVAIGAALGIAWLRGAVSAMRVRPNRSDGSSADA
jgi:hypothetical protein